MMSTSTNYGRIAQIFHWLSALLILLMMPIGLAMTRIDVEPIHTNLYQAHIVLGIIVLLLTAARIVWRFVEPTPNVPSDITGLRRLAFHGIHILQYVVLALVLASGVAIMIASNVAPEAMSRDFPPIAGHAMLSRVFFVLLLAHLGAVIQYQIFHGKTLERMLVFRA